MTYKPARGDRYLFSIQVCDDYLGILFLSTVVDGQTELVIWDWTAGECESVSFIS